MNNDLSATVRLTEEELDAIMSYWVGVGEDGFAILNNRPADCALAVARLRYWDGVYNRTISNYSSDLAGQYARAWRVTPQSEIEALRARGENPYSIKRAKSMLGIR